MPQSRVSFAPYAAFAVTVFVIVFALFLAPLTAGAQGLPPPDLPKLAAELRSDSEYSTHGPQNRFTSDDRRAALESVQFALTEVADGSSYVWHRSHGRLSGVVKPTQSFKDSRGAVCRHFMVVLSAPERTRKTETIACRGAKGVWKISG